MVSASKPPDASEEPLVSAILLVLSDSEEHAKLIESHLRNAGHRVRVVWVASIEELDGRLVRTSVPDALLVSYRDDADLLARAVEVCRKRTPGVPVLALSEQISTDIAQSALAAGARDLVCMDGPAALKHLERIWLREFTHHRNLRDLAETRARLADYESRYAQLVSATGDAVAQVHEGILSHANPALATLLGYAASEDLNGVPLMDLVSAERQDAMRKQLQKLHQGKIESSELDCRLLHREGRKLAAHIHLTRADAGDEPFVALLIRAGATGAAGETGLPGRLPFFEALASLEGEAGSRAALFAVVDGFAGLEERIGYDEAERILLQVGAALRTRLPPNSEMFRFSTHEFAVIVSGEAALAAERLAFTLTTDIAGQVFSTAHHEAQLTVTITIYPLADAAVAGNVIREIVRDARQLSTRGGNRSAVLGPTARAQVAERHESAIAESVRQAIADGRLKLAYQTIASLEGDSREHFDVLVRMIDKDAQEVVAADFIVPAEKAGLMRNIDRWVVGRVLHVLETRVARADASMLFVKLSEDTLKESESFLAWLNALLKTRALRDHELCFEAQELVFERHIRKAKVLAKVLRDMNAQIAIEHFGIGVNSAQLVEQLPVAFLKFHRSYTQNFSDPPIQRKMSKLMEVAKQRGIKTIVSHVEDANVMAGMWQLGVNYVQGFHIREPEVVLLADEMSLK